MKARALVLVVLMFCYLVLLFAGSSALHSPVALLIFTVIALPVLLWELQGSARTHQRARKRHHDPRR